jgi:phosphate uptake regulator
VFGYSVPAACAIFACLQNTKLGRAAAHARRVAVLSQKLSLLERAKDNCACLLEDASSAIESVTKQLAKTDRQHVRAQSSIAALDDQVSLLLSIIEARLFERDTVLYHTPRAPLFDFVVTATLSLRCLA